MKTVPLLAFLIWLPAATVSFAADTAYQALRVIGNDRGQDVLNHVIEVQGRDGAPQPTVWKIVLDEPSARGGVRELEVVKGKIAAERTPVRTYSGSSEGAVMDFHKLNLDSEGAFTVAEKEASKAKLGFDSIDFTLRNGDGNNSAPVWVVQLLDANRRPVGTMNIAADTGAVMKSDLYGRRSPDQYVPEERRKTAAPPAPRREIVVEEERRTDYVEDRVRRDEEDAEFDDDGKHDGLRVGHRIKQVFKDAGATLEGFFTGKRTIDRRDED